MSEEFISQDDSKSYNSDYPVFDIDQMSVNSDNQKAIQYLQSVRDEAKQAPKCTYYQEGEDFQFKQTDPKYLIQPKGFQLNGKWTMNSLWQEDVIEQYFSFKKNIEQFRKLEQNSYQLLNYNLEQEEQIISCLKMKCQFKELSKDIIPTLFTFYALDYEMASKIIKWFSLTQKFNYNQCLWIYCALTQLEDPLNSDTLADINKVLQNCYFAENGMTSILITIIQIIFNKNMLTEFTSFFDNLEVLHKIKHIWSKFQLSVYENDSIIFESVCHKISRKRKQLKPISIQLGQEQMYLFKNKNPHGMLQLTVVIMSTYKTDYGMALRLLRNGQYVDIITQDINILKQLLQLKCLQTTFHDEFSVSKLIGKGSFAKVYLAAKKSSGIQYAIKAFNKEFMLEQFKGMESLENEIKVMRRLNQENLVHLHEAYETQNSIYFVLDLLQGGELLTRAKTNPFSSECLQQLMYNFIKALVHIHSKKCIHRDLKPENLLLKTKESSTDVVIADFGLATFLNEQIIFKRCGTPGFVAPEILIYKEDDPFYDDKCDIFSAGVIFYILLTGKQPFQGSDYKVILRSNKNCEINFNLKQIQQSSQKLEDLLRKMLQQNPKDRPNAETCLQHPYFKEIFNKKDLIEIYENLIEYEIENQHRFQKKGSFDSQIGSMELISRSPILNGRIDTIGSLSNGSVLGSSSRLEKPQPQQQQQQSKFSQFCQNMKNVQQDSNSNSQASPQNKRKDSQDLHKFALKNSYQKKQLSKDDDYVNEESANLEDAIQKLNSQTPKIGIFKKSASCKVPKTIQE